MMNFENTNIDYPHEELLFKYITGSCTYNESQFVEEWMVKHPDNKRIVTQLALIYHAQNTNKRINERDPEQAYRKVERKINKRKQLHFIQRVAIVASIVFGIAGLGSLLFNYSTPSAHQAIATQVTVYAKENTRTKLILPDGTEVHLNNGSSITYPSHFAKDERKVTLRGEAFFKVAQNNKQFFNVSAYDDKYNIKVLGTEFNVQAYDNEETIETTLVSGSIYLDIAEELTGIMIKPSQKAIYSMQTNQLQIVPTDTKRETDWMYDRLVFKDTPMPEVLLDLARFYGVNFDVKNDIINTYTFTGTFENRPLYQVMDYIKISSKINYTIQYPKNEKETQPIVILTK